MFSWQCLNCYKKGHRAAACTSKIKCLTCKKKHNTALHVAWISKYQAVALLIRNVSLVSLLTLPVIVATGNLALKMETNMIHDNGALISLMSKEITDAIGIHGEARPLDLSKIGDSNLVQQAFKTEIDLHDKDGTHVGKAWVHVISGFVDLKAVDWSIQAAKFPHLASINFPKPFIGGKCHLLIGNDNHHLSTISLPMSKAKDNAQFYPYAMLTPLGWCLAWPTLPPTRNDPVLNLMVKEALQQCQDTYRQEVTKGQAEASGTDSD
jgi:hypothetical protein